MMIIQQQELWEMLPSQPGKREKKVVEKALEEICNFIEDYLRA